MNSHAIIFGAIGSLAETSDIQRKSFNAAFKGFGLDWVWSAKKYKDLLRINGGRNRIKYYADNAAADLTDADITKLHQAKTDHYEDYVLRHGLLPRPGVAEVLKSAQENGVKTGFASTTSQQNIDALFEAFGDALPCTLFDFMLSGDNVSKPKPDPEIYKLATQRANVLPQNIVVIEDTPVSARAALKAELRVIVTPGQMFLDAEFSPECIVVQTLERMTVDQLFQLT